MPLRHLTAHHALLDRADRAVADSIAIRAQVQAGLIAAGRRRPFRAWAGDPRPSSPSPLEPLPGGDVVELWLSVARSFAPQA